MESKNIVGMSVLGLTFLFGAQGALAQVAIQPQSVPFGSFVLVPTVSLKTVSDDNIYNLSSGGQLYWKDGSGPLTLVDIFS